MKKYKLSIIGYLKKMNTTYCKITRLIECFGMPLLTVIMRFYIAKIFFNSGLSKLTIWQSTLSLFEDEYQVPFIPFEIAAYIATFFELTCPIFLIIGLASRIVTLPLLFMLGVIQLTYLSSIDHFYWGIFLCTILFYGPGKLSVDHIISKKFFCKN